ncbi:MAG TPA: hopanoid biosynthesis-associated protein HpnK [Blastocatellia bacterium]|nr:hopanoid biosynthesis-associated protein HpnK [Blastocatellia bacterium]
MSFAPSSQPLIPLIINGDDFGYSSAVNRAILQAHQEGVLTSTSLMVNERAADEAVQLAKATPSLAVGLHLVLVLGRATLSPAQIPHLVNAEGKFTNSPFIAGVKYFFSSAARRELRTEMRAQFEKFVATGLPFSHVDGHTHLHMHPVVFDELLRLCEEFQVKRLRLVKGEMRLSLRLDRSRLPIQLINGIVFNWLARRGEQKLRGRGFVMPEQVYGLLQTGNLNEEYLLGLIPRMARTSCEIYAHPLAPDAEEWNRRENPHGARELQALLSPRVRAAIQQAGFQPSTYQHLS